MQVRDKPVLFIDIDGVISLWGFDLDRRPAGRFHSVDGVVHFLSSTAGNHLLELSTRFELVWCSGWEEKANEALPQAIGVGPLPYLSFDRNPGRGHPHWKLAAIEAYAGAGRAIAWIDDAFNAACHAWAADRAAPTLLVRTEPHAGIGSEHVARLAAWDPAPR